MSDQLTKRTIGTKEMAWTNAHAYCDELEATIASLRAQNEWVSVEERLPDYLEASNILLNASNKYYTVGYYSHKTEQFLNREDDSVWCPTHWMTIPD